MSDAPWYEVRNAEEVPSPALLLYPDRVQANIERMLEMVGRDASRLRPHVKTHKMAEVVRMQLAAGITKFKCATIAETEMTAGAGGQDVLLSYQPVGPNQQRFAKLVEQFPETRFSTIVDCAEVVDQLASLGGDFELFVDLDCGMGRTGIPPEGAIALSRKIRETAGVRFAGIHAYDGHIHAASLEERRRQFAAAMELVGRVVAATQPPRVIGGGSPTFAMHADETWECSPGTTLFWDAGYGESHPDLDFQVAAVLLTRVVSKPGTNRLCLDLGHKAVAAENPLERRVRFLNLDDAKPIMQSEEHLVVEVPHPEATSVGDVIYGVPIHICPTVALHEEAHLIREGQFTGEIWQVAARRRKLTV